MSSKKIEDQHLGPEFIKSDNTNQKKSNTILRPFLPYYYSNNYFCFIAKSKETTLQCMRSDLQQIMSFE